MASIHVYLAGDSTVSEYDDTVAPRAGWGQVIGRLFTEEVVFHNAAASGRSSKSFIDEGRLEPIAGKIAVGDYFLIQFGHNDEKDDPARHTDPYTSYKEHLTRYLDTAREKGAFPVLITPVQRRKFGEDGVLKDTHGEYPIAMKQLAQEQQIPLIDLGAKSKVLLEKLGAEEAKKLFLWYAPGEQPNYPEGNEDDTHFSETGALEIAQLVIEGMKELDHPLVRYLRG